MAWVAFNGEAYVAGTLGAGAMFTLPVGEIGLDARGDLVLSTDEARSTLMVRDLSSGAVLGVADTGLIIDNGLLRGDQVYVSARSTDGSVDAGVLTGTSPGLELQQLLLAAPGGPRIGETRAPVKVSPSGLTIGSTVCTTETPCGVQSVNLTSGALTTIDDFYLRWISDEVAIVSQGPLLRAYALSNLKLLWTIGDETPANEYQDGYFRGDGALVLQWLTGDGDDRRYEIVLVDSTTGDVTVVASFEPEARTYIAAALSTDTRVVLVSESTVEGAVRDGAELQVLNLATRAIEKYASPFAGTSQ